ncbi:DsrE family protein [Sulfurimonas sp. HSL3-2]|uniref:DsrE family protein n=1 Tax=Hydrocurvibacter mobilis TaxID=3131936 RepID=UPI0031FA1421
MKDKLLIVISTDNADSIMKFPLLYGGVSLPRDYWKRVHVMFWGASIMQARDNKIIREKVLSMQKDGVEFSSCIVCAQEYEAVESLEYIGIPCNHTGELLTEALKSEEWSVLTI